MIDVKNYGPRPKKNILAFILHISKLQSKFQIEYIITLERQFEIKSSLNMNVVNLENSETYIYIKQECTNYCRHVTLTNQLFWVLLNICRPSIKDVFHVTLLEPRILMCVIYFSKSSAHLIYGCKMLNRHGVLMSKYTLQFIPLKADVPICNKYITKPADFFHIQLRLITTCLYVYIYIHTYIFVGRVAQSV